MRLPRALASGILITALGLPLWGVGASGATAEPRYFLPAPAGTVLEVTEGNDHPMGRRANEVYAYDFVAAEGSEPAFTVLAARGGIVLATRAGVRDGRCDEPADGPRPPCWRQVNYVLIDHGDGSSGLYMHLRRGSLFVRNGQVVSRGTPLGRAGRTGWTSQTGMQLQVQQTPGPEQVGRGGWFLTPSLPLAFSDPGVLELRPDGVPLTGDLVTSANPAADREPFLFLRRPPGLPVSVPLPAGQSRVVSGAFDPDAPEGFGLTFAPAADMEVDATAAPLVPGDPGSDVRPLFGGELLFAGCATGRSASLGLTVVVRRQLGERHYDAIHGHLTSIDGALLAPPADPLAEPVASPLEDLPLEVTPGQVIGGYGALGPDGRPVLTCLGAGDSTAAGEEAMHGSRDLFVAVLRDAEVTAAGEISGGTPVSPEPLVGRGAYEGFLWWPGPVTGAPVSTDPGRPRGNWHRRATANAAHVPFGQPVSLVARVSDSTDIREVRFRAFYPGWARSAPSEKRGFDPASTWRVLAVCRPSGVGGEPTRTSGCTWEGDARAATVTFRWDPALAEAGAPPAWLPRARTAISRASEACVPVSLAFEVIDASGHARVGRAGLPAPTPRDARRSERAAGARLVYLDPLVPPPAPRTRGPVSDRAFPPVEPDPLDGRVVWRDRAANEDGYRIYARRNWLNADCDIIRGRYVLITTLPAGSTSYRPRHQRILRAAPAPDVPNVPGSLTRYEVFVAAFNEAGESDRVYVGGFVAGGEGFCDTGPVEPPPGF
ncbi:hypothetical protein BH23CHL8_BH23CHL8_23570 [soil metagenome]